MAPRHGQAAGAALLALDDLTGRAQRNPPRQARRSKEPTTEPDRCLVERAAAGDRQAFHQLYQLYSPVIFGFLRARVGRQGAEDLTAETFCRAFEHIGQYEHRGIPFRAWLLRVAYNLVVGGARRRSSGEVPVADPKEMPSNPSHEDDLVRQEEFDRLRRSLAELSPERQAVLDLRYLRELSVPEAAAVLGITEGAVRALTYRALKALRRVHRAG